MPSKTKLFKDLGELGYTEIAEQKLDHKQVSNETYGKMSCIYLTLDDDEVASKLKRQLKARGHHIGSWGYDNGIEVRVSYFKGWHWDE